METCARFPKIKHKRRLDDREIVAAHISPGIKGKPRPIIVKDKGARYEEKVRD